MIPKKNEKKADERSKPWSLLFGLNCFTHELIDPQTNKILLIIWGQTTSKCSIFSALAPRFFGLNS
jgi:hypothetical protein